MGKCDRNDDLQTFETPQAVLIWWDSGLALWLIPLEEHLQSEDFWLRPTTLLNDQLPCCIRPNKQSIIVSPCSESSWHSSIKTRVMLFCSIVVCSHYRSSSTYHGSEHSINAYMDEWNLAFWLAWFVLRAKQFACEVGHVFSLISCRNIMQLGTF